jgi:hypothetical protein
VFLFDVVVEVDWVQFQQEGELRLFQVVEDLFDSGWGDGYLTMLGCCRDFRKMI